VLTGRVTRVAEFGAFVELEPGVEALAHISTFAPTGRPHGWKASVAPGMEAAFEILSIDLEKKRVGVALVPEGSTRASGAEGSTAEQEAAEVREYSAREGVAPAEGFGSLADKFRDALLPRATRGSGESKPREE